MTVAELIEALQQLPGASQTATVISPEGDIIYAVLYEYGQVFLNPDERDDDEPD